VVVLFERDAVGAVRPDVVLLDGRALEVALIVEERCAM
jgi:hypothetical protein